MNKTKLLRKALMKDVAVTLSWEDLARLHKAIHLLQEVVLLAKPPRCFSPDNHTQQSREGR